MEIYVQSRGKNQEHGYRWLKITQHNKSEPIIKNGRLLINPPVLGKVIDYISSSEESSVTVVLAWEDEQEIFLVYGLDSGRTDFHGRKISNDVAWVGQVSNDEDKRRLREIATCVLKNWEQMKAAIQKSVKQSEGEYGFEVIENLQNLHEQFKPSESQDCKEPQQQEKEIVYLIKQKFSLKEVTKDEFSHHLLPLSTDEEKKKKLLLAIAIILGVLLTILGGWWLMSQRQESPQKIPIPQILINPQLETQSTPIQATPQSKTQLNPSTQNPQHQEQPSPTP